MAKLDPPGWRRLGRDLFLFRDSCNVYILRRGNRAVAVDFGTGSWCQRLGEIGVDALDHIVLTHLHRDQCCGLYREEALAHTGAQVSPARRRARVPAGSERRLKFSVAIDGNAPGGRHLLAVDVATGDRLHAEAGVALVDIDAG